MFRKISFILSLVISTSVFADKGQFGFIDTDFQESNIEEFGLDQTKVVALTFDDGPGAGTEQILDTLKLYHIKATFFAVGAQLKSHPALARRIVAEGHVLANHSYTHPNLRLGKYHDHPELLVAELMETHQLLKQFIRPDAKLFFRAPYADWQASNAQFLNQIPELRPYVGPICWDVGRDVEWDKHEYTNAADWECWGKKNPLSVEACGNAYLHKIDEIKGGVVLMHDIHQKTAEMVALLIPKLIGEGYKFKTIEELTALDKYEDGSGSHVTQQAPPDSEVSPYHGRCLPARKSHAKWLSKPTTL